jgi:hypothetical protein
MIKRLLLSALSFLFVLGSIAQVTTSSLTGVVKTAKNEPLAGATIKATHTPTGTVYTAISLSSGKYTIANMRPGGPYKVEITFVGLESQTFNDLNLELGTPLEINAALEDKAALASATVTAHTRGALISPEVMGTSTNVSLAQLTSLPTITRNIDDFTRLTPQANAKKSGADGSTLGVSLPAAPTAARLR